MSINDHELYMSRAIDLARYAQRDVFPNPKVGCVIVYNNEIIGEGYHKKCGEEHAEVNAINSVKNKELLAHSILYVTLEPCSHHGKTPPCAGLIIKHKIPEVFIGARDPNPIVRDNGIKRLESSGVKVEKGVLAKDCDLINLEFNCLHEKKRPYITLKWAESEDGFIDRIRSDKEKASKITNELTDLWIHRIRANSHAIMVGTNTVLMDNPRLTQRFDDGSSPIRITIDNEGKLNDSLNIFDPISETIILSKKDLEIKARVITVANTSIKTILQALAQERICSVLVEGGAELLTSFLKSGLWDSLIKIQSRSVKLNKGIRPPVVYQMADETFDFENDVVNIYQNND